jgi:hypothetical protein
LPLSANCRPEKVFCQPLKTFRASLEEKHAACSNIKRTSLSSERPWFSARDLSRFTIRESKPRTRI